MILKRLVLEMIRGISDNTLVLQKQLVFEHTINNILDEAFIRSSTRTVRDEIVALDPSKIKPAGKINRVYAPQVSPKEFKQMLEKKFETKVDEINPGGEGSKSSKFPTFRFKVNGKEESIVLAKGIIAGEEGEKKQESSIDGQIKQAGGITLEVTDDEGQKHRIEGITGFTRVPGNRKADFVFTGNENIYIQHKSPSHQQMSGTSKFSRKKYRELDEFIDEVAREVENSPNGRLNRPMFSSIKNPDLKKLAVYGDQNGTPDGVQIYAIGDLGLEGKDDIKRLTATRLYTYPEIPEGEDEPVLGATYRKDRNQYGIPQVRFGIYPASYAKGLKP